MAFFRCGGSGIPASLKSGMNSVLNKKFGTSTTYDPSGWPDAVNLLGPLPIKSASGAIASFADGADGVPVKSCVVSFLPSGGGGTPSAPVAIVGHSGITLTNKDNMSTPTHTDTYTDTFGQTIMGGSRDLTTDKATSYGYLYDLGSNNWNADANRSGVFYSNVSASGREASSDVLGCECFDVMNINVSTSQDNYISGKPSYGSAIIFIRCTDFAGYTGAQVKEALTGLKACLKTATPTEITGLTPHEIDTLYGDNNIYADTGTTEVEYRADIDLALNA